MQQVRVAVSRQRLCGFGHLVVRHAVIGRRYRYVAQYHFELRGYRSHPGLRHILSTTYANTASKWISLGALWRSAYRVTPVLRSNCAYRYLDLGSATTGRTNSFDASQSSMARRLVSIHHVP